MSDDCIFCKIIKGDIPSYKVYEDDKVIAFLDTAPNNFGHTLVVPKKHTETLLDTPDETLSYLMSVSKKVAKAVLDATGTKGFNLAQNNFPVAGQEVPHVHFHIIPRLEDDDYKFWPHRQYAEGQADELAEKIRQKF